MKFGIDRLLADPTLRAPLAGKRVALLAHPASVTADLTHTLDALAANGGNFFRIRGYENGVHEAAFRGGAPDPLHHGTTCEGTEHLTGEARGAETRGNDPGDAQGRWHDCLSVTGKRLRSKKQPPK